MVGASDISPLKIDLACGYLIPFALMEEALSGNVVLFCIVLLNISCLVYIKKNKKKLKSGGSGG